MKLDPSVELVELLGRIRQDVQGTDPAYEENFVPGLKTQPIPFFGRLEEAEVLTVGLNPSSGEFDEGRWPDSALAAERLAHELHNYFHRGTAVAHPWFGKWSMAVAQLNANLRYEKGRVAHVDLSPRATIVASRVPNPKLFAKMMQHDMKWLPALLECAKTAQILLVAGTVSKQKYLIEFLAAYESENHIRIDRTDGSKRRTVGFYELHFRSRLLPVFFSGAGPSARDQGKATDSEHF